MLDFSGSSLQVQDSEKKKKWTQQIWTVHDPVLIESTVHHFCGSVVMHAGSTKQERRVRNIIELPSFFICILVSGVS